MKLWKRDTKAWTARQVEGEPHPGKDEDGETCYANTHFEHEESAWVSLYAEAAAFVSLAGRDIENAEQKLAKARAEAGEAAKAFQKVRDNWPAHIKLGRDQP